MELTARRLETGEWTEAARVMARSLQESLEPILHGTPVSRLAKLYQRFEALPIESGIGVGAFVGPHIFGAARAVPFSGCMCRADLPHDSEPSSFEYQEFLLANHPDEEHWFVGPVGVEPGMQRAGIGTLAMQELVRLLRGAGHICIEAEDQNVAFYERLGFRPIRRTPAPDGTFITFFESQL